MRTHRRLTRESGNVTIVKQRHVIAKACRDAGAEATQHPITHYLRSDRSALLSQQWFALLKSGSQGGNRVSFGDKLMSDVAAIACLFDRLEDRWVLDLLRLVQFVAAWITCRVILADHCVMRTDGTNDVALHDLHMIDIVKQLHPR
jgi:hypothetical protein